MSAVVTRPQQDSHRCENLCSSRSLSDASLLASHPQVAGAIAKETRRAQMSYSSVRSFVVALSTLARANVGRCQPTANGIPTGSRSPASRQRTSNQASLPHSGFFICYLQRVLHDSPKMTAITLRDRKQKPRLTTEHATGKPPSKVFPSLVSNFEMKAALLSAVQRRSLTVCAPVRAP